MKGARVSRVCRLATAIVLAAAVSGCTSAQAWNVIDPTTVRLGDTALALYVNPQIGPDGQSMATGKFLVPGYVVLVQADGSYRSIETSGMDMGQVTWTDAGLFFADDSHDYWLSEGLHAWPSAKSQLQEAAVQSGASVLSVYNQGIEDDGYHMQVVDARAGHTPSLTNAWGLNDAVADCSGTLYGVSQVIGPEHTRVAEQQGVSATSENQEPFMVVQLYPAVSIEDSIRALLPTSGIGIPRGNPPCSDGTVTHLGVEYPPEGDSGLSGPLAPRVFTWDTETGQAQRRDLVTRDGDPLAIDSEQLVYSTMASDLSPDGRLIWIGYDGYVRATDPSSGVTEALWDSHIRSDQTREALVQFRGDWVYVLDLPNDDPAAPITLTRFDLATGDGELLISIPGLNEKRDLQHIVRGLAVSPNLDHP